MSDNIPFEIQMEIIKKVSDVKSLIQFRSVSKPWKSFVDSSEFIEGYGAPHTKPHSFILMYKVHAADDRLKYVSLVEEDDHETLKVQEQEFDPCVVVSPLFKRYHVTYVVGASHGLVCFYGYNIRTYRKMVLIWNPSIGKSFGIDVPRYDRVNDIRAVYGFRVCPVTSDPTVVKIICVVDEPWHVEVFTLSSGVWNAIPSGNFPCQSITLHVSSTQAVIDGLIYWGASTTVDGVYTASSKVVSFDLSTKEFKVVDLPDNLTNELLRSTLVSLSELKGSLVVSGYTTEGACGVWMMEHDSSFTKLFSFGTLFSTILGFRRSGETIFESRKEAGNMIYGPCSQQIKNTLEVYDPCSQQIKNLGISGVAGSFFMDSYKQSLLLLDHPESHIYSDDN